ncbi:hypothetical protein RRF57_004910 [Xylaria bambusicola]|uniref:Uncharacterized protein n=1 Tax=Xylaria bambusicola TaxID=326684 RepID=A0AAN7YXD0_9PEZI
MIRDSGTYNDVGRKAQNESHMGSVMIIVSAHLRAPDQYGEVPRRLDRRVAAVYPIGDDEVCDETFYRYLQPHGAKIPT